MSIYKEPPPGMFVVPDTVDMTKIHALITGPFDTPYEGGFFLFVFRCPPDYPIHPPRVKLMTTGNNTVRFNPNFYRNGKVCLSILGTWTGPAWSPAQSISSVLISIQSLMTENPYHNEPGFEQERHPGDSKNYNECIRHETIRVAVCDMMEGKCPCPEPLRGVMEKSFLEYYDFYEVACKDRLHLQGQTMQDPFGEKRGHFDYQSLLMRLGLIRQKVLERLHNENAEMDSDSSSSGTETDLHGKAGLNLTALALRHLGPRSSHLRGRAPSSGSTLSSGLWQKTTTNAPLHQTSSLGMGGRQIAVPKGSVPSLGGYLEGSLGWGAVCDTYTVWVVVCLSVCLSSVLKRSFPMPFSSLSLPMFFPTGQHNLFS